jgi:hypothetical protein
VKVARALLGLQARSSAFSLELGPRAWFDLMHWHPDIDGIGNASPEARSACLAIARQLFDKALAELIVWGKPSQCWFIAQQDDSGEDALYIHTPNPNQQNFPYAFEDVIWQVAAPLWLAAHFPEPDFIHGESRFNDVKLQWVVSAKPLMLGNP